MPRPVRIALDPRLGVLLPAVVAGRHAVVALDLVTVSEPVLARFTLVPEHRFELGPPLGESLVGDRRLELSEPRPLDERQRLHLRAQVCAVSVYHRPERPVGLVVVEHGEGVVGVREDSDSHTTPPAVKRPSLSK